ADKRGSSEQNDLKGEGVRRQGLGRPNGVGQDDEHGKLQVDNSQFSENPGVQHRLPIPAAPSSITCRPCRHPSSCRHFILSPPILSPPILSPLILSPPILSPPILSPPILSPPILSLPGVVGDPQPTTASPKPKPTTATAITCQILRMLRLLWF